MGVISLFYCVVFLSAFLSTSAETQQDVLAVIMKELQSLKQENKELNQGMKNLQYLKQDNNELNQRIKEIRYECNKNAYEMHDNLKYLETKHKELEAVVKENQKENQQLRDRVVSLEKHQVSANNPGVGFTAYPSEDRSYDTDQTILFDLVVTNYGNAYNPEASIFQCPVAGYYLFFTSLYTFEDNDIDSYLYLDGVGPLISTYSDYYGYDAGSNLVFTYCQLGQLVWVRSIVNNGGDLIGSSHSTFSGLLVAQAI